MASKVKLIDIPAQEALITGYSEAVVEQLLDFGKLVATDAHQLLSQLDAKLGAYLGFCAALIGLISVGLNGKESTATKWGIAIAIGLTMLAIISSLCGLFTRTFLMPSESDWFCEILFERPADLKRYHVISLLSSHQHALERSVTKARWLRIAESLLAAGSILAGLITINRIF